MVEINEFEAAKTEISRRLDRYEVLDSVYRLASELCDSVDCAAEDIGGQRNGDAILRELGPAVSAVASFDRNHR